MTWDPVWEGVFSGQAWGKYPGEDIIRFAARNFYRTEDRTTVRLLEAGCGTGANLWFLAREGFSVCGVDGSAYAVDMARQRLTLECPGWDQAPRQGWVVIGDIGDLPADDNSFDATVDSESVYCNSFEDSKAIYKEMYRVTKPEGQLFVRTFAAGSWGDGIGEQVGPRAFVADAGPLAGKGYSRFTAWDELANLLSPWSIQNVELITRTINGGHHEIREWIVQGEKQE